MTLHFLNRILSPRSVAVFGVSDRPGLLGQVVFANLRAGGFRGRLVPVNPRRERVQGEVAVPNLSTLEEPIDVAVVATPATTLPDIVRQCVRHGAGGAIVLSVGFGARSAAGCEREQALVADHRGLVAVDVRTGLAPARPGPR